MSPEFLNSLVVAADREDDDTDSETESPDTALAMLIDYVTDELIDLARSLIPPDRQQEVATSVVVKARRGG
jgi:hypothetical protein